MTTEPIRAGVIGWPVGHSRSPRIHGHWLGELGINGIYDRFAVPPDRIDAFLAEFEKSGLKGANVTIPYKENAFRALDVVHPAAKALGAANTLWLEDGMLHGDNTDGAGFIANLDQNITEFSELSGSALVLGAGGAARAVIHALKERGFGPIHVANRTVAKAEAIAESFGGEILPMEWNNEAIQRIISDPTLSLLVHTTSLGMKGQPPLELGISGLDPRVVVTDLIYAPLETDLIKQAKQQGNPAVGGLGMLIHQAVPGFERWFGARPVPDEALTGLLVADLEKS